MSTTSDGNIYFFVHVEGEQLKFGVPTAMAQNIAELTKKGITKKVSLTTAIANGEKAIVDAFRMGLHRKPKASKKIAPVIISCCLLSKEALEKPNAGGFILEISHSTLPSWSTDANGPVPDDPSGSKPATYAHYRAVAGRDEIDAVMAPRHAEATG